MIRRIANRFRWCAGPILAGGLLASGAGCASIPSGLEAVKGFEVERYMGTWYEIARLDHSFERNLTKVTAEYTLKKNGRVKVVNRGFDKRRGRWRAIKGTARFAGDRTGGRLKVTFFWPFWGAYNIIALDQKDYRYAVVTGPSRSYLWILCRDQKMDEALLADLVLKARQWGFDTDRLVYLEPNARPPARSPA
jgi:apolipoprotein D and lipocalin family protein